jgi:hypothetical protein
MLKCTSIVEEYENQKATKVETFYAPPNSLNQLTDENEPSWPIGTSR